MKTLVYLMFSMMFLFGFQSFEDKNESSQKHKTKEFELINGVNIKMIWVNPGSYIMGSPLDEVGRTSEREKQHKVSISKGFWLAETELTQEQWEKVMGNNPSNHIGANLPVDQVSFTDIQKFINTINGKNGKFKLPSEAEWEYACRAGSTQAYSVNDINQMVWHIGNSEKKSHPVAQKKANAWGFYDMQGNILEWCSDWFYEDTTNESINLKKPEARTRKVQRGGQFTGRTKHTRAADRQSSNIEDRDFYVGFRLARNAD